MLTKTRVPSSGDQEIKVILLLDTLSAPLFLKNNVHPIDDVPLALPSFKLILEVVHGITRSFALLASVAGFGVHELRLESLPVAI